jgi:hypothetical protein
MRRRELSNFRFKVESLEKKLPGIVAGAVGEVLRARE